MKAKILLIALVFLLSLNLISAQWSPELNTNLAHYYDFNSTSGTTAFDLVGSSDLVFGGVFGWFPGLVNNAVELTGGTAGDTAIAQWTNSTDGTLNFWVNLTTSFNYIFANQTGAWSDGEVSLDKVASEQFRFATHNGAGGANVLTTTGTANVGQYTMITIIWNSSTYQMYVNGAVDNSVSNLAPIDWSSILFGGYPGQPLEMDGRTDELGFWTRQLNSTEIGQLYNSGAGTTFENADAVPEITLNAPMEGYQSFNQTIDFNATVTDDIGILTANFYIDGILNQTFTNSTPNQLTLNIFETRTFPDGDYNWSIDATDTNSQTTNSATRTFTVDSTQPAINIINPMNITYTIAQTEIEYTAVNGGTIETCWFSTDGGTTNQSFEACNSGNFTFTAAEGSNMITVYGNDSANNIGSDTTTFFQDTVAPTFTVVPANETQEEPATVSVTFTATDATSPPVVYSQNNILFTINSSTGLLENIASLPLGTHTVAVTATDQLTNSATVYWKLVVTDDAGSGIIAVCEESDIAWTDAAALAGLIMTILLVGLVLGTLVLSVTGVIDIGAIGEMMSLENAPAMIVVIGTTFLVIATMSFLIAGNVCTAFGVG